MSRYPRTLPVTSNLEVPNEILWFEPTLLATVAEKLLPVLYGEDDAAQSADSADADATLDKSPAG